VSEDSVVLASVVPAHVPAQLPTDCRRRTPQPPRDLSHRQALEPEHGKAFPFDTRQIPGVSVGFQHAERRDATALSTPSETGSTCDTDSSGRLNRADPSEDQLPVRVFDAQPSLTSPSSHTVHTPNSDGVLRRDLEPAVRPKWTIIVLTLTSSPVLLFTPTPLREAFFWFGISAGILAIAYFYRTSYVAGLAFLLLSVLVVLGIRPNLGVLIAYPLVAVVIAIWTLRTGSVSISRIFIASTLIAALAVTFFPSVSALTTADGVETVTVVSHALANSGDPTTGLQQDKSGGPSNFCNSTSYVGILCNSLARLPAFIFGPFLWEIGPEPIWIVIIARVHTVSATPPMIEGC